MFGADYTASYKEGPRDQLPSFPGQLSGPSSDGMPQYGPTGHIGIGGSSVPMASGGPMRFYQMANQIGLQNGMAQQYAGPNSGDQMLGNNLMHKIAQRDPTMLRTPGLNSAMRDQGVRPGAVPQMNAVQQSRMQGPPPGPQASPRQAVLAAYPQGG